MRLTLAAVDATFDFLAAFVANFDLGFFLALPDFDVDFFAVDPLLALDPRDDFFPPVTDFNAFSTLPSLISERTVSTARLTGFLPFADDSPTIVPAIPPAIAPAGPATIAPRTAPVTPPAVCLDTVRFSSRLRVDVLAERPEIPDFFGMVFVCDYDLLIKGLG